MNNLGELASMSVEGVIIADRGYASGAGTTFWTKSIIVKRELTEEPITLVSEAEDPEAWKIIREASLEFFGCGDVTVVGVGEHYEHDPQIIYGAFIRYAGQA